jgi:hypothetical protein
MNILRVAVLFGILLKCVTASENGVAHDVIDALAENGFGSIKSDWRKWWNRKDLFDHMVTKSVEFIAGFINQVGVLKRRTLAALFIERSDEVDEVLKRIKYNDDDLWGLTMYRPELAESHENFFKVIDKINDPIDHEYAIEFGVEQLFKIKRHASVIHLINALENRQFNGRKLKDVAIQRAFYEGAKRDIKHIVETLYDHPAITSRKYAFGLTLSWEHNSLNIFSFLLSQADQDDLETFKGEDTYKDVPEIHDAIDKAMKTAPSGGTRPDCLFGRITVIELGNHRQPNHPNLDNTNPYDGDAETQLYLHLGCRYLAQKQAKKYETASVQKRVEYDYYHSCLNAIWPGHTYHLHVLEKGEQFCLNERAFKKGQVLTTRNNQPSLSAPNDGHYFVESGRIAFIFYAENKPPMNLDVLKKLPWPEYKDVLALRNSRIKNDAMISRSKQQVPNVNIILDSKKQIHYPFPLLKLWMHSKFKLDKYDPAEIERLRTILKRDAPDVTLYEIHKTETLTHVLPFHRPYSLIQPYSIIARRYGSTVLSSINMIHTSQYSTTIAEFIHQRSVHCLLIEFDLK